ncbi:MULTISPECIES: flagellar filament capping protein FliD [Methylomonas]|uniref:flagellar filament capping protein FliD n=1 Tax=Methylomonas TaxID=416 RepID=UPI0012318D06|nr:flagellar filament capping protein FliD [Methylomonas rhizoryzae]
MSIVSSTGLGSGIDIQSLVSQLTAAEKQPAVNAITRQQDAVSTRLSGLGSLKSALSTFQTAVAKLKDDTLFKTHAGSSADESIVKATASSGSVAGNYAVEVKQLAKAQKSISNTEFASSSATVGTGTLTFATTGGSSFNITVDSSNNTLAGIRDAINASSDNSSVTASIINVDNGSGTGTISKLVLTAKNSGTTNAFTVSGSDDDGNDSDASGLSQLFSANLDEQTSALDAIIEVDGQTATRSTNSISDVLQGVTLDLQKAEIGTTVNVNVSLDTDAISKAVSGFVSAYNALHSTTAALGKYGGSDDGTGNGALIGDATLRLVTSQIRQNTSSSVSSASGNYNSLAMIGVTIDKSGVMSLDETDMEAALNSSLSSVAEVFSSDDGVATRLDDILDQFLQSGGSIDSQTTSLNNRSAQLEDRLADVEARSETFRAALLKQFTAMDVTVGQFNSTGSFLSSWISNL